MFMPNMVTKYRTGIRHLLDECATLVKSSTMSELIIVCVHHVNQGLLVTLCTCYHIYICSQASMMEHTDLSLFLFRATFYMGYQHGTLQLHFTSEPCSSYFPCQDWDSGVYWDDFGDDLVHWSRAADQELVHTVIEGLISWIHVYMVRSCIFPWFSLALWCISNTYVGHVRMIMVTYAYMFYIALTWVMLNWGIQCEDCCPCHAQTKCNP